METCDRCGDEVDWEDGEQFWADDVCHLNDHVPLCPQCSSTTYDEHRSGCDYCP